MERDTSTRAHEKTIAGEERFREYYSQIFTDYASLIDTLKQPLLCTFRVTPSLWSSILKKELETYTLVRQALWGDSIYEVSLSKKEISARGIKENARGHSPEELQKTHTFLKLHSSTSSITRQEGVSMIPVTALDLTENSVVLDMCASPGSKSSQVLEVLGKDGVLICNDVNNRRTAQLIKQTKRFGHPGLVVTCNDATMYPRCGITPDRVLCDVPCSGDGTLRKNSHILTNWSVQEGLNLFSVQCRILKRGADMLAPGGTLVYSTCSLNPVENELVVMSVLEGRADLEVVPFTIPGLTMREGLGSEHVLKTLARIDPGRKIKPPMPLESIQHTRRVAPQDQNTGGFFIAKLRKMKGAAQEKVQEQPLAETEGSFMRGTKNIHESCFYRLDSDKAAAIEEQWGKAHFALVTKTAAANTVYGLAPKAEEVLLKAPEALKVVFGGVRLFSLVGKGNAEDSSKERWRVSYEGLPHLSQSLHPSRVAKVSPQTLLSVLEGSQPLETLPRPKHGLGVLRAQIEGVPRDILVPTIDNKTEIEVLLEKDLKDALAEAIRIKNRTHQ
ncbi:tRNA (cytosine34-C5)-methyltransferase [Nematocida displodere]|uniref:tRNA (Cytosine34-C5)-methyltransferase n=1 Tax=Nematocida displodere TaxID=1805483 RepID=A0A177EG47_9MICR|nr:tRNA (cytosine34-C5)-methyltransferase [Nematocida displodere]